MVLWMTASDASETAGRPERRPRPGFPFRLARGWSAAACLLAVALALLLGAGAAEAQTSIKLVGNIGLAPAANSFFTFDHAQAFNTGGDTRGYKLTRVDVGLRHASVAQPTYSVSIHADSSGSPGTSLGTLTNPSSLPSIGRPVQFTAPGDGIDLARSTTYHVVVDVSTAPGSTEVHRTDSNAEDPGRASGWGIADGSHWRNNSSTGAWTASTLSRRIAIYGYAKSPPPGSAWATGKVLTWNAGPPLYENEVPAGEAFRVSASNRRVAVSAVSLSGSTVTLTLEEAIGSHSKRNAWVTYVPGKARMLLSVEN